MSTAAQLRSSPGHGHADNAVGQVAAVPDKQVGQCGVGAART